MMRPLRTTVYISVLVAAGLLADATPAARTATAQLGLPPVTDRLDELRGPLDVERRARRSVERAAGELDAASEAVGDAAAAVAEPVELAHDVITAVARRFAPATAPDGTAIEDRIVIMLVDAGQSGTLAPPGLVIIDAKPLPTLELKLLTLRYDGAAPLADILTQLRGLNPEATVDFNHHFESTATQNPDAAGDFAVDTASESPPDDGSPDDARTGLRIGIVDSAVQPGHRALSDIRVVARDFATHEGERPLTHGTAVASLVARSGGNGTTVYAASVFFQLPGHAPGATAEGIVAALDWLAAEKVDAINMSLAGPGNALLAAATKRLVAADAVIVAAVGNAGPKSPPLFPAAYDGVIGVTAVDGDKRIFRYANRGEHVDFAAVGVRVRVADSSTGGWRIESGTSMASPHIAVVAAQCRHNSEVAIDALGSWLMSAAEDLGRRGFDPVFGHGLITSAPVIVSSQRGNRP